MGTGDTSPVLWGAAMFLDALCPLRVWVEGPMVLSSLSSSIHQPQPVSEALPVASALQGLVSPGFEALPGVG